MFSTIDNEMPTVGMKIQAFITEKSRQSCSGDLINHNASGSHDIIMYTNKVSKQITNSLLELYNTQENNTTTGWTRAWHKHLLTYTHMSATHTCTEK